MVKLSVTPVYCPECRSLLVDLSEELLAIQLTLSLRLLTMLVTSGWLVHRCQPVSVLQVQSCTLQKKNV